MMSLLCRRSSDCQCVRRASQSFLHSTQMLWPLLNIAEMRCATLSTLGGHFRQFQPVWL